MSKRLYLLILFAVTLFCGCKDSNPLDSTTKVSFSIPARVLEDVGNNNGEEILVCTQVLRGSKVIIDEKYERTLFFDENNKPCIESIVLENIPLYTSLVLKMQIFVGEELFAEGQSEKTLFTEGKNTLNLQLKLIPKDDDEDDDPEPEDPADPEIELKIDQTSITVEEWEENAIFTATEGFDSYNWTCGDQTGTTKEFVVDISKLNVGEYEVTVVATKGETECHATSKLTVNEISTPLVITEKDVVVEQGNNVTFVATKGFDSYSWSCGNSTSTEESFTINTKELSLGENTVRLKAKKGTKEYTTEAKFSVIQKQGDSNFELIIETTEITVTEGENATFTALEGFDSYYWECGNQSKSGTNIFTVDTTNLLPGKYIVKLIVTKGTNEYSAESILVVEAKSGEVTSDITINQLEVKITAEINNENRELILTATEGFINYIWEFMGEQSPITSNNSFSVDIRNLQLQGSYVIRVIATDKNGNEYSDEYIYCPAV